MATTFRTANGREFVGYVTPASPEDQATLQPTLVLADGQIGFWLGWIDGAVAAARRLDAYRRLGLTAVELFPASYRIAGGWSPEPTEGTISGFGRLEKSPHGLRPTCER